MAQPIYKLWQGRFTAAWYELSESEQQHLLTVVPQALIDAGAKELVICSAAWSDERWPFFGVEQFPDIEAVQGHRQRLDELGWSRYMESRSTLGNELVLPS